MRARPMFLLCQNQKQWILFTLKD